MIRPPFAEFKRRLLKNKRKINKKDLYSGTTTRNPILEAAIEAENEALTKNVIIKGWKETGVHPFKAEIILNRVKENLGSPSIGPQESQVERDARRAASSWLSSTIFCEANTVVKVNIAVEKNTLFHPEDIIQKSKEKEKEREREQQEKEENKRKKEEKRKEKE